MTKIDTSQKKPHWRTEETHNAYMAQIDAGYLDECCRLCEVGAIQQFTFWKIAKDKYPYDRVATVHDMLIPIRHTDGYDLSSDELNELTMLKKGFLNEHYEFMGEGLSKSKTIPEHFHMHLIVTKQV